MTNLYRTSRKAIAELLRGNEFVAQTMFRENARNSPCCLTLHNLGIFYIQYGMLLKTGRIRSAQKIGLNYLLKASKYGTDWRNEISIASFFADHQRVREAYQLFSNAYMQNPDVKILYNIGACLFRMEDFPQCIRIFESMCSDSFVDCILRNGGQHPLLTLAFCQLGANNKQDCVKYLQKYRNHHATESRLDVFYLRCMCGLYEEALSESQELINEWYLTDALLALLAECVTHIPTAVGIVNESIPCEHKKVWLLLRSNSQMRQRKISDYVCVPPMIDMYPFIE